MSQIENWKEVTKRTVALGFAAVYMHTHSLDRAPSLRVAYLAYRFLNGEDVAVINADADHDIENREEIENPPRRFAWLQYYYGKKK